ncbi:MAG: phenylalanine 4-monooxygenase [Chitinophagales bacterium]|nr:phenylalanine 4-monooxygenase [Chitinophagales bacterium]
MIQAYDQYTQEDHEIWSLLYAKMAEIIPKYATDVFIDGMEQIGFESNKIPNFDECNARLKSITGWVIYPVPGLIDNKPFFEHLANKEFPASTWLRKREELDYLEEPDMFHDVYGHVPLLSNMHFTSFLENLARITLRHIENPWIIEIVSRLYWYTVEFGLIREEGKLKVYGAGILSSNGETQYSIESDIPKRLDFDVAHILQTPYIKDKFQEQYFVIDSYKQLFDSIGLLEEMVEKEAMANNEI